jgi:protein-S-isoprenylcysteine O-methyltransferase Ste14
MNLTVTGSNLLLSVFLSLVALCSFAWALRGHFETVGRIPKGMRRLSVASLISYAMYLGLLFPGHHQSTARVALGLIGLTASIILFWWTVARTRSHRLRLAYTDADPDTLYSDGPYALVRHPFYLSYVIFWVSTAVIAGTWQWVAALIFSLWYGHIARSEERRFASSRLSLAYTLYQQRTGMLLPRPWHRHWSFSRSGRKSNELREQIHGPRSPPAVAVAVAGAGNHTPDRSQRQTCSPRD